VIVAPALPTGLATVPSASPQLAPDGKRVAMALDNGRGNGSRTVVIAQDGSVLDLPPDFIPLGWVDAATVVGTTTPSSAGAELSIVRLNDPARRLPLGVTGIYIGAI